MTDKNKDNWVAWSYDSSARNVAEDIVDEINGILKEKNIYIGYYFDEEQEDWDYKLELSLDERKDNK
jgi:hypothetical protein